MTDFKVGEVLLVHSIPDYEPDSRYNGEECIVLALQGYHESPDFADCYFVELSDRTIRPAPPEFLKRKPPSRGDMDEVVSWENCVWRPREKRKYLQDY